MSSETATAPVSSRCVVKRTLVSILLLGLAIAAGALIDMSAAPKQPMVAPPPNVLIIITDDQSLGMMRVMPKTVRYFGRGGERFTHFFDTTPVCCPSRASVFTGRYAHNHHVLTLQDGNRLAQGTTIQRYLEEAGYQTAMAGKYLNLWDIARPPPYFTKWALFDGGYYNKRFNVNGRVRRIKTYSTAFIANQSLRFLSDFRNNGARPWFLYVAPYAPHSSFQVAPKYKGAPVPLWHKSPAVREKNLSDKPPYIRRLHESARRAGIIRRERLRTLMSVDDLVGRIFSTLHKLGEDRNTLAFFLSDNGWLNREHGFIGKRPPYLGSVEVPFYIRWPGHVPAGASDSRLAGNIDIMPTILQATGLRARDVVDGRSLLEASPWRSRLLLEQWKERGRVVTAERGAKVPDWASTVTRAYQYIEYYGRGGKTTFREYYDLRTDPWQLHNLLGDRTRVNDPNVAALSRQLHRDKSCAGASCP